jgi:pimeloyl-ACP methyl ester carboxylesterase
MTLIEVNGTALYYERRRNGPAILLVSGATGDAGHWTEVAEVLASRYTVVTYDRRGNSRSPLPPDWTATTIDEHADDAEALISGLHLAPAIVLGTSAAAGIVTNLAIRHPSVLRGVILHEPTFQSGVTNAEAVRAGRLAVIQGGIARGGPRGAVEALLRSVGSDELYDSLNPALRERLLANADVLFDIELAPFVAYKPAPADLARMRVACVVTAGAANRDPAAPGHWRYESAQWLAAHLMTDLVELPGGHMAYLSDPHAFAEALIPPAGPASQLTGAPQTPGPGATSWTTSLRPTTLRSGRLLGPRWAPAGSFKWTPTPPVRCAGSGPAPIGPH